MITVTMPVLKRCPFVDELDAGRLSITFAEDAPELHNLAAQVQKLCAEPVTHEDFTRSVLDMLGDGVLIVTRWHTGPFDVEVREGDESLAQAMREFMAGSAVIHYHDGPGVNGAHQVVREPDQISEASHA